MKFAITLLSVLGCFAFSTAVWQADPPFYAQRYQGMGGPRGLWVDPAGDLLCMTRGGSAVSVVWEHENEDGSIDVMERRLLSQDGLNHGVTFNRGYIYASSGSTVWRWPYIPGTREVITTPAETVITGMPGGGDHDSRTLIFDSDDRLYVTIGSAGNVDQNSDRSRVVRFIVGGLLPIPYAIAEVFADGVRNECGLAFDNDGVLHGVENGADLLNRPDLGGPLYNGNPCEEFNRFDKPSGTHYGYPYCFSTYNLTGYEPGTQFAWPSFMNDGTHTDDWCKNTANNNPPIISMGAHTAPLGMDFFRGQNCDSNGEGAFPCNMTGNAVVAMHGSWNSDIPVGYRVTMFPFQNGQPTQEETYIVYEPQVQNCYSQGCIRPVNVVFNNKGHLYFTSDSENVIIKVTYGTPPPRIRANIQL